MSGTVVAELPGDRYLVKLDDGTKVRARAYATLYPGQRVTVEEAGGIWLITAA